MRKRDVLEREELRSRALRYLKSRYGGGFAPSGAVRTVDGWRFSFERPGLRFPVLVTAERFWGGEAVLSDNFPAVRFHRDVVELVSAVAGRYFGSCRVFCPPQADGQTFDPDVTFYQFRRSSVVPFKIVVAVPGRAFRAPRTAAAFVRDLAGGLSAFDVRVVVLRDDAFAACDARFVEWAVFARNFLYLIRGAASDEGVRVRFQSGRGDSSCP